MSLNVYMGYNSQAGSNEGAVLIFANTSKEARKIGWADMKELFDTSWLDMAVRRLRKNTDYLKGDADPEKLAAGIPHVVTDMRVCPHCQLWGEDRNDDYCGYCLDE